MKTLKYFVKFPDVIINLYFDLSCQNKKEIGSSIKRLKRYCCYDSRRKRLNFEQEMKVIFS